MSIRIFCYVAVFSHIFARPRALVVKRNALSLSRTRRLNADSKRIGSEHPRQRKREEDMMQSFKSWETRTLERLSRQRRERRGISRWYIYV